MPKLYVPKDVWLACDKGTSPSTLRVTNNENTTIYSQPMATEADKLPYFNILPMGICSVGLKTCIPIVSKWDNPKDGVKINGNRMLLHDSTCRCIKGGKITIHFERDSAVAYGLGEGKMPSEYIKEGFDWIASLAEENIKARDSWLPEFLQPVAHVVDWFNDLRTGLAEGAINGVVGLGEALYQVVQDPIGMGKGLSGMVVDAAGAVKDRTVNAWNWASDSDNWKNAADSTWNWARDTNNWKEEALNTWQWSQDKVKWYENNPRDIGTTVGEFIPDTIAAGYTMGGSIVASTARVTAKESVKIASKKAGTSISENVLRQTEKKVAQNIEKETAEAVTKKTARETIEALVKNESNEIARVITKEANEIAEDALQQAKRNFDDIKQQFEHKKASNKQKGNFGEIASNDNLLNNKALKDKGYNLKRIGNDAPTGLDDKIRKGIDGIYENTTPPPKYVIDEAKYGSSKLNPNTANGPQMSDDWINELRRLENQVGEDKAREIKYALEKGEVDKVLSKIDANGKVTTYRVKPDGSIGSPWP